MFYVTTFDRYSDELYHFGIKGMKWGVRRYRNSDGSLTKAGKKHQAKEEYRSAKRAASKKYTHDINTADSTYAKAVSKRDAELKSTSEKFKGKQKAIDSYYKKEIRKNQSKADKHKEDMDFWGEGNPYYNESKRKYDKRLQNISDIQKRYDAVSYANKLEKDKAMIKVRELYGSSSKDARNRREAMYAKAGEDYATSTHLARMKYREAKRKIKRGEY